MKMPANSLITTLLAGAVRKMPRQGRSLASFERMLAATRSLMLERGEDFTLLDVSQAGEVSIGSIYLRFDSKDKLLQAVIAQELLDLIAGEEALYRELVAGSSSLEELLDRFVQSYSAFLQDHAGMLGMIMRKAASDPAISGPGKETFRRSSDLAVASLLRFADEFGAGDREGKARAVFHTVFAAIARFQGLGASSESADREMWEMIRSQLPQMMLAYLRSG